MHVLEVAHSHTACDAVGNSVFEEHEVLDFVRFGEEVGNLFFGCGEFAVNSVPSANFLDDVVVPEAHVNGGVFLGDELQELHVGEVVVRDIASDAASVRRQEVPPEEFLEIFAQSLNVPGQGRIEINMQVADKKVFHVCNLYSAGSCVNGGEWGRRGKGFAFL